MAHVNYVYSRLQSNALKRTGGVRLHFIAPTFRRTIHILCGFLLGLLIGYTVSSRRSNKICVFPVNSSDETVNWKYIDGTRTANSTALLFIGVMTAQKYLESRGAAVYDTWGKEIEGKIIFFSSATSAVPINCPELPLVRLKNVDDSYPPQKKSFKMLQYMWEHFGADYEWFLRADDDVYIRPDKVENFLRSINSSKPYFIGQAGRGNQEEFGLLSLEYDENFCMGGPGIILSRETLRRVAPHIKYCLQNLYTTHEDVELGRCVQKFARISCTWSYEMQSIFYHNFSGSLAFTSGLKTKEVHHAITLHPIKQYQHMYRVHNYMQGLKIRDLQQRKTSLYRDFRSMEESVKLLSASSRKHFRNLIFNSETVELFNISGKANLLGVPADLRKYQPRREDDIFTWDLISRSLYSDKNLNPRRKIESHLKEGLDDVIRELMDNINLFSRERGRVIEFQQILYAYYRMNPLYGPDYILDVLLTFKKYRGKKMTVPVRRHAYIQQQFSDLEIREVSQKIGESKIPSVPLNLKIPIFEHAVIPPTTEVTINMIVPLYHKHDVFIRFMQTYEHVCLREKENVDLYIILFLSKVNDTENQSTLNHTEKIVDQLTMHYPHRRIKIISVRGNFARAKALDYGMAQIDSDGLMFFVDVDMVWTAETLRRIRSNTEAGKSVYFPIVFSQFDPIVTYGQKISPNHFLINDEAGYWRIFGYGIASAYKADVQKVGGFNTSIVGWGREDVDLLEKFITISTNVSVLRSVDPNLVHIFHVVDCASSLDLARLTMCRNTRSETYGSVNLLGNLVYNYKQYLFQYALSKLKRSDDSNR